MKSLYLFIEQENLESKRNQTKAEFGISLHFAVTIGCSIKVGQGCEVVS